LNTTDSMNLSHLPVLAYSSHQVICHSPGNDDMWTIDEESYQEDEDGVKDQGRVSQGPEHVQLIKTCMIQIRTNYSTLPYRNTKKY